MTKTYDIDCELSYQVLAPTVFLFKIQAAFVAGQTILSEQINLAPSLPYEEHVDALGNRTIRVTCEGGPLSIRYVASVTVSSLASGVSNASDALELLPMEVLPYTVGSRYVESELLFNEALARIGSSGNAEAKALRIRDWVRTNIKYQLGTSQWHGTARDVLASRTGVCRDLAHLTIAFCRALNLPARFVVGHVQWETPPPDFHALVEVWAGGRWMLIDPTGMAEPEAVIRIGTGQDASQVPFATIYGTAPMVRMSPLVFASLHDQRCAA